MYFKFEDYLWYQSKTIELEPWLSFKKIVKICILEMLRLSDFDIMTTFTMWLLEKMSCKALFICISQYSKLY